ncbi:serine hydrolase domain-containing protein, partial [Streptomyces sp. NPDC059917]|uniref:serine hydrolase domain-containing protein n=1 Tax=Streptomyces sp. NPDC059917 TaxID=3347002 RepID=UPI00365D9B0E
MPTPRLDRRHRHRHRISGTAAAAAVLLSLLAGAVPAATAADRPAPAPAPKASGHRPAALDRQRLDQDLDAVHAAGLYGAYAAVRDGADRWRGATGFADVDTRRPTRPDMRHRIGSVTKTFTAVAVLQQAGRGRIELDRPVGDYLPDLVPGERGRAITVRMLLNQTSGIADYLPMAFPSLLEGSPRSLDDNRHRHFPPTELIGYAVGAPQVFEPGARWSYSNTNYVLLGELLRATTGEDPETVIARDVIHRAHLRDTYFPGAETTVRGPHAKLYESFFGAIDPPRDYSDYDMSWGGTAGALVATMDDVNTFYRALLQGRLLRPEQLRQLLTTVPVKDAGGRVTMRYGLGIVRVDTRCGPFWGHDGAVFGGGTLALSSTDGGRQLALGANLSKYERLDASGNPLPNAIDAARSAFIDEALCGGAPARPGARATGPDAPRGPDEDKPRRVGPPGGGTPAGPGAGGRRVRPPAPGADPGSGGTPGAPSAGCGGSRAEWG